LGLPHPINPNTYQIKTTDADRDGYQPKEGRYASPAKGAIGLLMLERRFVNMPAILIFDPDRVTSVPLVLSHLNCTFEVRKIEASFRASRIRNTPKKLMHATSSRPRR
jgi:hypothetical protein